MAALQIYATGLPVPAVEGVIEVNGRHGIIFERVDGPTLLSRMTAQPWTLIQSARLLAELQARMHTHHWTTWPGLHFCFGSPQCHLAPQAIG